MNKLIEGGVILFFCILLDLMVFGPLIDSAFELGITMERNINGVTAPVKDFFDPIVLNLWNFVPHFIEICGMFGMIELGLQYFKTIL